MNERVEFDKAQVVQVLRWLEEIVLSLDQIETHAAGIEPSVMVQMKSDFIDDWDVCRKLAQIRSILSKPIAYDELEDLMADVPHWRFQARLPP